jgi:hypothetical protein
MMHSRDSLLRSSILTLVCGKCTRTEKFGVANGEGGVKQTTAEIRAAGWIRRDGVTTCPRCPQTSDELACRANAQAPFDGEQEGDQDEPEPAEPILGAAIHAG